MIALEERVQRLEAQVEYLITVLNQAAQYGLLDDQGRKLPKIQLPGVSGQ